jgi:hypothetical protein
MPSPDLTAKMERLLQMNENLREQAAALVAAVVSADESVINDVGLYAPELCDVMHDVRIAHAAVRT